MELQKIFNGWAKSVASDYAKRQWLLSLWEVVEGVEWPQDKCRLMVKIIAERLELKSTHTLVDLGCGGGWILSLLKPLVKESLGVDFSLGMLDFAKAAAPQNMYVCAEMGRLPFKNESFDRMLSYFVYINITDDVYVQQSIHEALRILKPGGRALIGQMPDKNGSRDYDAAKEEYIKYCEKTYRLGKSHRGTSLPPLRLFDKEKLGGFLSTEKIRFQFRKSFNPFYRPGAEETVNWRFDLILEKS